MRALGSGSCGFLPGHVADIAQRGMPANCPQKAGGVVAVCQSSSVASRLPLRPARPAGASHLCGMGSVPVGAELL